MDTEVVANVNEEVMINVEFERMSLVGAIKKLSSNYGDIMNTEMNKKRLPG